ncbi:Divalent-cation tolerance protein CutA [compost metagenome]
MDSIKSVFWWEGKVENENEVLLILKSRKVLLPKIIKTVKANHTYQVPEVIALPIVGGNKDYLSWVDQSTK